MASLKELKDRIGSVKSTQKITKAKQMVAAAKLRRAQANAEAARPYSERLSAVMASLAGKVSGEGAASSLDVELKYFQGAPVIEELNRISKPGRRVYAKSGEIQKVRDGLGVALVSTSRGIMTDKTARESGVGGEIICTVF